MPNITVEVEKNSLKLSSYDGSVQDRADQILMPQFAKSNNSSWTFSRSGTNHAYLNGGTIDYSGNCSNNLIVSENKSNSLKDVSNSCVIFTGDHSVVMPIAAIQRVMEILAPMSFGNIRYSIPHSVIRRERTNTKSIEDLSAQIEDSYGISLDSIAQPDLTSSFRNGGVYLLSGKDGTQYIFKRFDKSMEFMELLCGMTNNIPSFFPRTFKTRDNGFSFQNEDGIYCLQEHVKGTEAEEESPLNIGRHIGLLHNSLSSFRDTNLLNALESRETFLGESSLISVAIDIGSTRPDKFKGMDKLIEQYSTVNFETLPKSIIHGDLNCSNILMTSSGPKFIDSEMMRLSTRINEFVPALLLKGRMQRPSYFRGGLNDILTGYNEIALREVSSHERQSLSVLLRCAMLRYYAIRSIRRNLRDNGYWDDLTNEMLLVEQETDGDI